MQMEHIKQRMKEITDWLQKEFSMIRTGQASPSILDNVKVESYGTKLPLVQVASVGIEDARTLRISPWDSGNIKPIEKGITDADIGVSVVIDDTGLRAVFPELTGERREQLAKLAKSKLEDARVSVRSERDDAIKQIETAQKNGEMSEDDKFGQKDAIQKLVDKTNAELEELYKTKEREILG